MKNMENQPDIVGNESKPKIFDENEHSDESSIENNL